MMMCEGNARHLSDYLLLSLLLLLSFARSTGLKPYMSAWQKGEKRGEGETRGRVSGGDRMDS